MLTARVDAGEVVDDDAAIYARKANTEVGFD